jgi:RasGEF domain
LFLLKRRRILFTNYYFKFIIVLGLIYIGVFIMNRINPIISTVISSAEQLGKKIQNFTQNTTLQTYGRQILPLDAVKFMGESIIKLSQAAEKTSQRWANTTHTSAASQPQDKSNNSNLEESTHHYSPEPANLAEDRKIDNIEQHTLTNKEALPDLGKNAPPLPSLPPQTADSALRSKREVPEKEIQPQIQQPSSNAVEKRKVNNALVEISNGIKNGEIRLSTKEGDVRFNVKERTPFYQKTFRHSDSSTTAKEVVKTLENAVRLGMTEITDEHGRKTQIKDLISEIKESPWGKKIGGRDPQFSEKLGEMHSEIQQKLTQQSESIIANVKEIRKLTSPDSLTPLSKNATEAEIKAHDAEVKEYTKEYQRQRLLIDMAPKGQGDPSLLEKEGIITPEALLVAYPTQMTTEELFKSLNLVLMSDLPNEVKTNLIDFTVSWLQSGLHTKDLDNDAVREQLENVLVYCKDNEELEGIKERAEILENLLQPTPEKTGPTEVQTSAEQVANTAKWIQDKIALGKPEDARELARALMGAEASNFNGLTVDDLKNNKVREDKTGEFNIAVKQFNNLSTFIGEQILNAPTPEERKKVYQFFVKVAAECVEQNNFNSGMAIFSGLNSAAVLRLSMVKKDQFNSETKKEVKKLESLFSGEGNYKILRQAQKDATGKPLIPYLGVMGSDLTFIQDANPETQKFDNQELIDPGKLNLFAQNVGTFLADKQSTDELAKKAENPPLREILGKNRKTEDELYNLSLQREPRPTTPT